MDEAAAADRVRASFARQGAMGLLGATLARVAPGRIMFEIDGVADDVAREALRLGAAKLPIKTRVVTRIDAPAVEHA